MSDIHVYQNSDLTVSIVVRKLRLFLFKMDISTKRIFYINIFFTEAFLMKYILKETTLSKPLVGLVKSFMLICSIPHD